MMIMMLMMVIEMTMEGRKQILLSLSPLLLPLLLLPLMMMMMVMRESFPSRHRVQWGTARQQPWPQCGQHDTKRSMRAC